MMGMREKRRFRVWTDDGQEDELVEFRKIIDTTTMRSKGRETNEGEKSHFVTTAGEPVDLVQEGVYQTRDGLILCESRHD